MSDLLYNPPEPPEPPEPRCDRCKKRPALAMHTCPYDYDVNNDRETKCNCCDTCTENCAADI